MNKKLKFARFFVLPLIISIVFALFSMFSRAETFPMDMLRSVIFLGDSTTNSLRFWKTIPYDSVWTGDKCTLSMWDVSQKKIALSETEFLNLKSLPNFEKMSKDLSVSTGKNTTYFLPISALSALKKPSCLVITLGLNGCAMMSETDFKEEYTRLIRTVKNASPTTKILLNSIFPVAKHAKVANSAIDRANGWISDIATEEDLVFLDTNTLLKNEYGEADPALVDSVDGIHWNEKGCRKIMEVFQIALQKYMSSTLPFQFSSPS